MHSDLKNWLRAGLGSFGGINSTVIGLQLPNESLLIIENSY
jgi:hypothetical protein